MQVGLRGFIARIRRPEGIRLMWEPRGDWPERKTRAICGEDGLVHVVDPFVHRATTDNPTYLRLHGITGAGHVYTDAELQRLYEGLPPSGEVYVMFNDIPRVGDSKRFMKLLTVEDRVR